MLNAIFRFFYFILGWKIEVRFDKNIKQGIFAVSPHNSWKDFIVGLGCRAALRIDAKYLGKAELFKPPFGFFFYAVGGVPVIRTAKNNVVDNVVETFKQNPNLIIALAPEGTRKPVSKLRTGFYFIAHKAQVPIIMTGFDFTRKLVIFDKPFMPTGDFEKDMVEHFIPFFRGIGGHQKEWLDNYEKGIF
jgi:1-acyl-sn-glycerol-3-phosphate acyltransferase